MEVLIRQMAVMIRIAIHNPVVHIREVRHDQQLWIHYLKRLELKNQKILLAGLNLGSSHLHLGIETKGMGTNKDCYPNNKMVTCGGLRTRINKGRRGQLFLSTFFISIFKVRNKF